MNTYFGKQLDHSKSSSHKGPPSLTPYKTNAHCVDVKELCLPSGGRGPLGRVSSVVAGSVSGATSVEDAEVDGGAPLLCGSRGPIDESGMGTNVESAPANCV